MIRNTVLAASLIMLLGLQVPHTAAEENPPDIVCNNPPYDAWAEFHSSLSYPWFGQHGFVESDCRVHLVWHYTGYNDSTNGYLFAYHKFSWGVDLICEDPPC